MEIEILVNGQEIDIKNISVSRFNEKTQEIKEEFSKTELDFSSIHELKGNKELLEKSFQQQKAESLNL